MEVNSNRITHPLHPLIWVSVLHITIVVRVQLLVQLLGKVSVLEIMVAFLIGS